MESHEKIRIMREISKCSQEEMAEKLSMSPSGYAKIERGETKLNIPRLQQLATIFNVDVWDLMPSEDKNFVYQVSNDGNNTNLCYSSDISFSGEAELQKLQLTIKHQAEIIQQKDTLLEQQARELQTLQEILAILKQK